MIELVEEIPRVEVVAAGPASARALGEKATLAVSEPEEADSLQEPLRGAALVVVVADECGGALAPRVARAARIAGAWTVLWCATLPEGDARGAWDAVVALQGEWERLIPGIEALLDMVRSSSGVGFEDLDRLRLALRGRCTLGLGGEGGTLMDSAREALADLARQGADASRAEGLLVCVRGPEGVDPDEVGQVVGTLRHAAGGGPVAPGYVVDDGPLRVVLLQAGGRVVPRIA